MKRLLSLFFLLASMNAIAVKDWGDVGHINQISNDTQFDIEVRYVDLTYPSSGPNVTISAKKGFYPVVLDIDPNKFYIPWCFEDSGVKRYRLRIIARRPNVWDDVGFVYEFCEDRATKTFKMDKPQREIFGRIQNVEGGMFQITIQGEKFNELKFIFK